MSPKIDQSGKIEDTAKNTILCISNDEWKAVKITAKTKRQIQEIFRRHGQVRNFILLTFCAGLVSLLKQTPQINRVTIDEEYTGKNSVIKKIMLEMFGAIKTLPSIHFAHIGKKSSAHNRAYAVALGKLKAQRVISFEELWEKIKMTEVGKRLKNA